MSKHISSSSRRVPSGPRIELIEDGARKQADVQPATSSKSRRGGEASGSATLAPPATRFGTLRLVTFVVVAAGATVFGLLYLNDRLAVGTRATANVALLANVLPLPAADERPEAPAGLPPPDDAELAALEAGTDAAMAKALVSLRGKEVTPAGLRAVNLAARRTDDVELQRQVTCYRVRGGAPLDAAFSALPIASSDGPEWKAAGTDCLIEAIAARANEAPERAIGLAVAAGAATRWPARVKAWLVDSDRAVRRIAHTELLKKGDADSRLLAATALAADASDEELTQWAVGQLGSGDGFDRQLAAVAADATQPASTRARAAGLVGQHGGAAACRVVAAIASAEPALESELAATRLRIDRRFGPGLRAAIRR